MTESMGKKNEKNLPCLSRVKNYHNGGNMQGFLWTPWNATSRTTAQDALWHHFLDRNTSSQPFMTPCARQVMNRIPGNVTPPWAGCWGPLQSCWMSGAIYLPAQRNRQPARPTPRLRPPSDLGKATLCPVSHLPAIWNHLHVGFQWRNRATWTLSLRNFLWTCMHKSRALSAPVIWCILRCFLVYIPTRFKLYKNMPSALVRSSFFTERGVNPRNSLPNSVDFSSVKPGTTLATKLNSTRLTLLKGNCSTNQQQSQLLPYTFNMLPICSTFCRFWQQISNNVNVTSRRGRLCCRYGRLRCQCVRGQSKSRLSTKSTRPCWIQLRCQCVPGFRCVVCTVNVVALSQC